MTEGVGKALAAWGLTGAHHQFVAARENAVYAVEQAGVRYALRLHRKDYRSDTQLYSELDWMAALDAGGLSVPSPVAAQDGQVLQIIEGTQVDLLSWLNGQTMEQALEAADTSERRSIFKALGRAMAELHKVSDAWVKTEDFDRVHWDVDGLLGAAPLWDRFWENPDLIPEDKSLFAAFRNAARAELNKIGPDLDYGLIHADLVPSNVLIDAGQIRMIDFDDGGFGYRLFEIATVLLKHRGATDFSDVKDALFAGYLGVRSLDMDALDLFLALRAATYVGWNIARMDEAGGPARNARFITTLRALAEEYIA